MHTKINQLQSRFTQNLVALVVWAGCAVSYTRAYTRTRGRTHARVGMTLFSLLVGLGLFAPTVVSAAAQGYNTQDKTLSKGMAVAIASTQASSDGKVVYVEKSSVKHADKTLGVVVDPSTDTVAVSSSGSQVYVATSGGASVYVTDLNGSVSKGDLLAPSPIAGVLMRVVEGSKGVLGVAQSDFPAAYAQTVTVDENGSSTKAKVALVQVNMDVKFTTNNQTAGKTWLQRVGETIVHHEVSTIQVLVALVILILLMVVEGGIIYGAVSSSIVALGRNPLAKTAIMKGLGQVTGLVAGVMVLGIAAVYLVLWI